MIFGKKKSDTDTMTKKNAGRKDIVKVHEKTDTPVLSFSELDVQFKTEFGRVHAVRGVDIDIHPGEVVALARRIRLRQVRHLHVCSRPAPGQLGSRR